MSDDYLTNFALRLQHEEQAIYALPFIEQEERQRLKRIARAREYLWNIVRARRAGASVVEVPERLPVDCVGFRAQLPRTRKRSSELQVKSGGLPRGCEQISSGRVRVSVWLEREKIILCIVDATEEQLALAGRAAAAGRAARDAGGDRAAILRAAAAVLSEEQHAEST